MDLLGEEVDIRREVVLVLPAVVLVLDSKKRILMLEVRRGAIEVVS